LTVSAVVGTRMGAITFDAPVASFSQTNLPHSSGANSEHRAVVTIAGINFAPVDATATASYVSDQDHHSCATTSWTTSTFVSCLAPHGISSGTSLVVTVAQIAGTDFRHLSFDAPVLTSFGGAGNSPTTSGAVVTISGLDFGGHVDYSPTAAFSGSACMTTSWTATTSMSCVPYAPSVGAFLQASLQVGTVLGTSLPSFTFDSPVLSGTLVANGPRTGGSSATITGMNFAGTDRTPTSAVGTTICLTVSWSSDTAVRCLEPVGSDTATNPIVVIVAGVVGTRTGAFSYDGPVITGLSTANFAGTVGLSLTVVGMNFGVRRDPVGPDRVDALPVDSIRRRDLAPLPASRLVLRGSGCSPCIDHSRGGYGNLAEQVHL